MHGFFLRLSRIMAVLGGIMLSLLILLTCASIIGRALSGALHGDVAEAWMPDLARALLDLGVGPIMGDFELTEAGMAFAIFAFLPYTHLTGGHADVDIFTGRMGARANRVLTAVIAVVFACVLVLIAWQLWAGTLSKYRTGQTTFLIQFPIWWAYALALVGAVVAAIVGVYVAVARLIEAVTGRQTIPQMEPDP
jgi:TRAP-type C4-dicarboxylate transport system permease small subunit